jgi:hypothetical protein
MFRFFQSSFLAIALSVTPAFAKECSAVFVPTETTGLVTRMSLFNFGDHWELQFDTPSQLPLLDIKMGLDGVEKKIFISGGLDDLLFNVSSTGKSLDVSKQLLRAIAKSKELTIQGRSLGKPENALFNLENIAEEVKRLTAGCK